MDRWFQVARLWFRSRFLPGYVARDLDHELHFHLEQQTAEFMASGLSRDEAVEAACERLGSLTAITRRTEAAANDALHESLEEWRDALMLPRTITLKAVVVSLVVLGTIAGFTAGKLTHPLYVSEAVLTLAPPEQPDARVLPAPAPRLDAIKWTILSRTRLERLVMDLNLYPALRQTAMMEDVIQKMRSDIDVVANSGSTFSIRFTGEDPETVMRVTERLAAYFKDEDARRGERDKSSAVAALDSQAQDVGRRLSEHEAQAKAAGTTEDRRVKIETAVLESTYTKLLTSLEEERGRSRSGPIGQQFILIEAARKPDHPVTPSVLQQTWIGALGGLATGIAIALVIFGIRMWRGRPPSPMPELAGR